VATFWSVVAPVPHEGVGLFRRRRQAGQVERQPPRQGDPVGLRRGLQALLLQPGEDEGVNRIADCGLRIEGTAGRFTGRNDQCLVVSGGW
jgi:hypothetical protein